MNGYWYRGEGGLNFGDALTPLLFRRIAGITLQWAPPPTAGVFAIGSNIELIPPDFRGIILGAGIARSDTRRADLGAATVLSVRGNLTRSCCGLGDVVLADPGLLAADLLDERPSPDIAHGYIRHFADRRRVRSYSIDVLGGADHVVREAARCRRITSSSLHGMILADALGIPNRWSPHRSTHAVKFEDYGSSFGEVIKPYVWRLADPAEVAVKRASLLESFRGLAA